MAKQRPRPNVDETQTVDCPQRTKSYIRPQPLECTPCILRIVGRRTRPQALTIQSVLLGQSRQRPNPAPTNERTHDETGNIRPVHRITASGYSDRSRVRISDAVANGSSSPSRSQAHSSAGISQPLQTPSTISAPQTPQGEHPHFWHITIPPF